MKRLVIFLFLGLSSCLYSQGVKLFSHEQNFLNQAVLRAKIVLGAGLTLETGIIENVTLKNEIFLTPAFGIFDDLNGKKNFYYVPLFDYAGAVRYYYNFNKRFKKGKRINNFSGNYLASRLVVPLGTKVLFVPNSGFVMIRVTKLEFLWGMQRCSKNLRWNYGFALGVARVFDNRPNRAPENNDLFLYPTIDFTFAYNIFSYTNKHSAK